MNILITFSLIILLVIRIFILNMSISLYLDRRRKNFLVIIFGWIFTLLSGIFPLILEFENNTDLFSLVIVFNNYFFALGTIFVYGGFFYVFDFVSKDFIKSLSVLAIFGPLILWLFNFSSLSTILSSLLLYTVVLLITKYLIFNSKEITDVIGGSIRYIYLTAGLGYIFVPLSIVIYIIEGSFDLYLSSNEFIIILNYMMAIIYSITFFALFVNLQYSIVTNLKNQLIDTYSHDLGNIIQIIYGGVSILEVTKDNEEILEKTLALLSKNCQKASKLIKKIRKSNV